MPRKLNWSKISKKMIMEGKRRYSNFRANRPPTAKGKMKGREKDLELIVGSHGSPIMARVRRMARSLSRPMCIIVSFRRNECLSLK